MIRQDLKLDTNISKTTQDIILWKNENSIVDITNDTLAVKIFLEDEPCGYIFHGNGRLLLDAIAETVRGAVGEPIEKTLKNQFLMLGALESTQNLQDAGQEDLEKYGYKNQQEFKSKAEQLLDRLLEKSTRRRDYSVRYHSNEGFIFAFPNSNGRLDLLVAKDYTLVYKSDQTVFVKKGEKVVLTSHGLVAVSKPGKSIFLGEDCCSKVLKCIHNHDRIH